MTTFTVKFKRLPLMIRLLLLVLAVGVLSLTIRVPWWPKFLFELVLLELFCPHFNILGGSCGATTATYVFGWSVLAGAVVVIYLIGRKCYRYWQQL